MNDTPRGKLKITAPVTFGSYSLMPLITGFLRDNPDVEIDLHLTDRFVDPVEEGYEAAFRIGPLATTGLTARPLAPYRLVICAASAYRRHVVRRRCWLTLSTTNAWVTPSSRARQIANGCSTRFDALQSSGCQPFTDQ